MLKGWAYVPIAADVVNPFYLTLGEMCAPCVQTPRTE